MILLSILYMFGAVIYILDVNYITLEPYYYSWSTPPNKVVRLAARLFLLTPVWPVPAIGLLVWGIIAGIKKLVTLNAILLKWEFGKEEDD